MKFIIVIFTCFIITAQRDHTTELYIQAYDDILEGKWSEAIVGFKALIDKDSKSNYYDDAHFWIAYALNEKGEQEKAFKKIEDFIAKFKLSNLYDDALRIKISIAKQLVSSGQNEYKKFYEKEDENKEELEKIELQKSIIYSLYRKNSKESKKQLYETVMSDEFPWLVRKEALYYYRKELNDLDEKSLKNLYYSLNNKKLKKECIYYIFNSKNSKKTAILTGIAVDKNESLSNRKDAIYYIYQSRDLAAYKRIFPFLNRKELKKDLIYYSFKMKTDESARYLYNIYKLPDLERSLKKDIIYYLAKTKYPITLKNK